MVLESGMTVLLKTERFWRASETSKFYDSFGALFFGSFMLRPRPTKSDMNFTHEIMF